MKKLPPPTKKVYLSPQQVAEYLRSVTRATNASMIEHQARMLGVSLDALAAFRTRYDAKKAVLAFPMCDARRRPVGVRFRRSDGRKWALKGGREGVFIAEDFRPDQPVFVTEGPSDAATLWEVGFTNVLGRPSCTGGTSLVQQILHGYRYSPVIVVADPDAPGLNGATDFANALQNPAIVVTGPTDIREYLIKSRLRPNLTIPLRQCIVKALSEDEGNWYTVHRNSMGKFTDFTKGIQ